MRWLLKIFPPHWSDRYGEDFLDQFTSDPRQFSKWAAAVRTAGGLRVRGFHDDGYSLVAGLLAALTLVVFCDVALGVGMDERIGADLLSHWWGAPFAVALVFSVAIAACVIAVIIAERQRRRRLLKLTAGLAAGSFIGSAVFAALSFDLAGVGAGLGLVITVTILRVLIRTPLGRGDGLVVAAVAMILILGWRSASGPIGPLALLVVAGAILTARMHPGSPST